MQVTQQSNYGKSLILKWQVKDCKAPPNTDKVEDGAISNWCLYLYIGRTDLIKMHIATTLDVAPIAAWTYPLAFKHHDFLKQEIKILLHAGIICKGMSPLASPFVVVKKHTPDGSTQQFCLL